jgi:hypothetical protein
VSSFAHCDFIFLHPYGLKCVPCPQQKNLWKGTQSYDFYIIERDIKLE